MTRIQSIMQDFINFILNCVIKNKIEKRLHDNFDRKIYRKQHYDDSIELFN